MEQKVIAYIDAANLHKGSKELGHELDYQKFHGWLCQKFSLEKIYLFIGFISYYQELYDRLRSYGYILIFKETITNKKGITKGNCDAEIVLKDVSDYYEKIFTKCVIISGDGDFKCLIDFLHEHDSVLAVVSPNMHKSSYLIRKIKVSLVFLDYHYHKFSEFKISPKEKPLDADVSA